MSQPDWDWETTHHYDASYEAGHAPPTNEMRHTYESVKFRMTRHDGDWEAMRHDDASCANPLLIHMCDMTHSYV